MPSLSDAAGEVLVSTARTTVGDELRSITYFDESEEIDQVYLRGDLEADADLVGFADTERLGFRAQTDYDDSELGSYQFTIRVFDYGYLTRVIDGDHGVFVTTDPISLDRFEELGVALYGALEEIEGE